MAQQKKAVKAPQDQYSQRGKALISSVQRLRGWVGSDPSREPELADALVEVTAHRLLGHGYAGAAEDAQEAVQRAAQLLTAHGPIGPYTSVSDAARCVTAVVQVAAIQAGLGRPDAAGRTIESLHELREQLTELRLEEQLKPQTAIWALSVSGRAALASGDAPLANAYADAALARLAESGLADDADFQYLALDSERLASDARWAAGDAEAALTYLHAAKDRYDEMVAGRLSEPGRHSPAVITRLAEPLFGLYRDLADRLTATGEADLGLVTRRTLVDLLQGLVGRLGDQARVQLTLALTDLAADLLAADRAEEAETVAEQAETLAADKAIPPTSRVLVAAVVARTRSALSGAADPEPDAAEELARGVVPRGAERLTWSPLPADASFAATTAALAEQRRAPVERDEARERETAAWLEAERAEAHRQELERVERARIEAERRERERAEAERAAAARQAAEQAQAEEARRQEAIRMAEAEEAERVARKRRREERLEAHRLEVERQAAEQREAERLKAERRAAADPAEAERQELARLQAELAELELAEARAEAERAEAERAEAEHAEKERAEAEQAEKERAEAERAEKERVDEERAEGERTETVPEPIEPEPVALVPEPVALILEPVDAEAEPVPVASEPEPLPVPEEQSPPDELVQARQEWQEARARSDRKAARAALERVVELLRPRAEANLAEYGPQLQTALEELSSARLRSGDVWGSRAPAREAKALAKTLGR